MELPADRGASYRLAQAVGYVISPLVLPPLLFAYALAQAGAPRTEIGAMSSLSLLGHGVLPLLYVVWLLRTRQVGSIEIRDRRNRIRPMLGTLICYSLAWAVLALLGETARPLVGALAGCLLVNTVLALAVTLWWKISLHALSVAGFVAMLLFVAQYGEHGGASMMGGSTWGVLTAAVLLVMWARVRIRAHTVAQVMAGAGFGFLVPYAELWLLRWIGWI